MACRQMQALAGHLRKTVQRRSVRAQEQRQPDHLIPSLPIVATSISDIFLLISDRYFLLARVCVQWYISERSVATEARPTGGIENALS